MVKRPDTERAPDRRSFSLRGFAIPLLLAAITFLVYWPSLRSDFVYDARIEILEEGFVTSLSNLPTVLSLQVLQSNLTLADRPGHLLYLMLNAALWGKNPFGYHLASNLLHSANVALLYVLLRRLIAAEMGGISGDDQVKAEMAAMVVSLIFALHPVAVEAVADISYSSDLLITFFTLLALLAAMAFRPERSGAARWAGAAAVLCAVAAVMCKESGLIVSLLLPLYWLLFRRRDATQPWIVLSGTAMFLTAAFLAARFLLAPPAQVPPAYLGGSFFHALSLQPRLWVFMIGKLAWPVHLSADYTLQNLGRVTPLLAALCLAALISGQAWLAIRSRLGALGVAIWWLGLVTVSNLLPLYRFEADRFYYLPMTGAAMQLLALLLMLVKFRTGFWLAVAPLVISLPLLASLTMARQPVFANEYALWSQTLQVSPESVTAHYNLGNVFMQNGQTDDAIALFQEGLEINPLDAKTHTNLGVCLVRKGRIDEAMDHFRKAFEIYPQLATAHNDLALLLAQTGRLDEAIVHFRKVLELAPNYPGGHFNLGVALYNRRQIPEAVAEFQAALQQNPNDARSRDNLAKAQALLPPTQ